MRIIAAVLAVAVTLLLLLAAVFLVGLFSGSVFNFMSGGSARWVAGALAVFSISVGVLTAFLRLRHTTPEE